VLCFHYLAMIPGLIAAIHGDDMESETILEAFKWAPAIVALLIVNYFMYKLQLKKDEIIAKLADGNTGDIERQTKMLVLLEILVKRRANFRADGEGSNRSRRGADDADNDT